MKRLAMLVAVCLATLLGAVLFWRFRDVVVLFLLSLVLAAAVRPPINYLVERGWPRGLAMAATYLAIIGVLGGIVYVAGGLLVGELQRATDALAAAYEQFKTKPPDGALFHLMAANLPNPNDLYGVFSRAPSAALAGNALSFTLTLFDEISKVVLVLVLSIYWGLDQVHFERLWLSLLPAEQRSQARNIWRSIETGVGAYVRSESIQSLLAGIVLGLGFWALGLPAPVMLAVIGAVAWLIPILGGPLALVPVAILGLLRGPWYALVACAFTLGVFLALEFIVERRLVGRRRYSPILVVIVMIALADALGLVGLLVAPPLAAAIQIFFTELVAQPATAATTQPARAATQISQLRQRVTAARELAQGLDEPPPPELNNLLERLGELVEGVDDMVDDIPPRPTTSGGLAQLLAVPQGERAEAHDRV